MKVGSLFAGIGGFDLAASRVWGWDCVRWQVEIDPWARRVLAKHWPDVPRFGDIRELTGDELEPVDLMCGGFPCQPWSFAGAGGAQDDPRHLWPEMFRLVQALRPAWVVGENVPGLVRRMGLDEVCADLESAGYEVQTLGIPALAAGAPHLRERLWIVANAVNERQQTGVPSGDRGKFRASAGRCGQEHVPATPGSGGGDGAPLSHSASRRPGQLRGFQPAPCGQGFRDLYWPHPEPGICRVADGIPHRVDRLRGLGNAVVPQIPEQLFRWIDAAEANETTTGRPAWIQIAT